MAEEYAKTSLEEHHARYPQIDLPEKAEDLDMSSPQHRRAIYAEADLLHFEGVVPPALDKLLRKEDVAALFAQTFRYADSTFEQTDHYQLVKHPWYRAEFAWRRRAASWHAANTLWYESRVIALILALKKAPSRKDLSLIGKPEYPHPTEEGWSDLRSGDGLGESTAETGAE